MKGEHAHQIVVSKSIKFKNNKRFLNGKSHLLMFDLEKRHDIEGCTPCHAISL